MDDVDEQYYRHREMRERSPYFTRQSIKRKARGMSARLRGFRHRRPMRLVPEKSALLILDMQQYFVDASSHAYIPSAPAIIPGLLRLCEAYQSKSLPIILTRHLNSPEDAGSLARWWQDLIQRQDSKSALIPELLRYEASLVEKSQYDAFYKTDLQNLLDAKAVKQLVIGGVMTHLCCETTARSAFVRGLEVFFTIDGTATYAENFHRATLLNLAHGVAIPVLLEEILSIFTYGNS